MKVPLASIAKVVSYTGIDLTEDDIVRIHLGTVLAAEHLSEPEIEYLVQIFKDAPDEIEYYALIISDSLGALVPYLTDLFGIPVAAVYNLPKYTYNFYESRHAA